MQDTTVNKWVPRLQSQREMSTGFGIMSGHLDYFSLSLCLLVPCFHEVLHPTPMMKDIYFFPLVFRLNLESLPSSSVYLGVKKFIQNN